MPHRRALLGALLAAPLAGCAAPPAPPPPTVVNATVTAAAGANGGAPVALRLYQLASPAGFEAAQFFPLFNNDATVLKDDLVRRDDLLLAPGQTRELTLSPAERVRAIGVFAAFRDYEAQVWRVALPVPANQTSRLSVTATATGLTASLAPAGP